LTPCSLGSKTWKSYVDVVDVAVGEDAQTSEGRSGGDAGAPRKVSAARRWVPLELPHTERPQVPTKTTAKMMGGGVEVGRVGSANFRAEG